MWAPLAMESQMKEALSIYPTVEFSLWCPSDASMPKLNPPTYFITSEIQDPMQLMVNTYGVPRYHEANPATFAVVTFPFLFGVMFGDYGHGSIILALGLFLVLGYDYLKKIEGMREILWLRYFIMMMGMFSCYMGLLYNEWFAMPAWWFESCYDDNLESERYAN
jgi:V-type H+-transporting ATPase subunit a